MTLRIMLAALAAALSAPGLAQASQAAAAEDLVRVAFDTSAGRIVVALDRGNAPVTVANFLHYVDSGKLSGESFYRAMPYGNGGLIQGGVTSDARKLAKPIEHEPSAKTGLKHLAGTISMANFGPGTARSDFFILTTDIPAFDGSFAAFGRVVEGMDVVRAILASPVSPTKGDGPMKGQMLDPAVKIVKAERLAD
ncbi:MAG TPA: peptidylprolyl isomerase [Sphingomicrobium sp.]|jgi:peptidyl-prolyl cis-trans isomerase A (cyclophilin A)|nr:peptidylprolyl isomerase [Sphingomicrobium sp.]